MIAPVPEREKVCALIVTYHPDDSFPLRFWRIAAQVGRVVIVDNGSNTAALLMLKELALSSGAILIENRRNLGVAAALNQGAQAAQQVGYPWVISFDQDSTVAADLLQELARIFGEIPDKGSVAAIGANSVDPETGIPFLRRTLAASAGYLLQTTVITSGSLMPVSLIQRLGGFRSDFFVDHVDHEFCLKARRHGYRVYSSVKVLMEHSIGSYQLHSLLGVKVLCLNHSALRWYYIVRNFVVLALSYAAREPVWLLRTLFYFTAFLVGACLFEKDRMNKLRHVWAGLVDGLRGRMGEMRQGI